MRTGDELAEVARELLTALDGMGGVLALVAAEARAAQEALVVARAELEQARRPAPETSEADHAAQLVPALSKAARAADDVLRARFTRIAAAIGATPPGGQQ